MDATTTLTNGGFEYPDFDIDSKDKSGAFSGSGGMRFDTNRIGALETNHDSRFMHLQLVDLPGEPVTESGADFRFHLPSGGLDLCSLEQGATGKVPMTLRFYDNEGFERRLLYDCIFHSTKRIEDFDDRVTVRRNRGTAGGWEQGDSWTITGAWACLISSGEYATEDENYETVRPYAPFRMTIVAQ
jgi:hypothetical protein